MHLRSSLILIGFQFLSIGWASAQSDTLLYQLQNVEIVAPKLTTPLKGSITHTLEMDINWIDQLPKMLGNADPMHYTQLLPGVQTNAEYDAGLHLQGCDNGHNEISISRVPLYNVSHMFGLFSVFNGSHFQGLSCTKSCQEATSPNRLGGEIILKPITTPVLKSSGEFTIGPISSQGTLKLMISPKSSLILSARKAYLNLIYQNLLKIEGSHADYDFSDYNLTYLFQPDVHNTIWIDGYWGNDHFGLKEKQYALQTSLKWGNKMLAFHWQNTNHQHVWDHSVFYTAYSNKLNASQLYLKAAIPSSIRTVGYKGSFKKGDFTYGADLLGHTVSPQQIWKEGSIGGSIGYTNSTKETQHTAEYALYAQYDKTISSICHLSAGLRGTGFITDNPKLFWAVDPSFSLTWDTKQGLWGLHYSHHHQYLSQTGFSSMGMPTEFWYASNAQHKPQQAHSCALSYEQSFCRGAYSFSAETYFKRLYHQEEYHSDFMQLILSSQNLDEILLQGNGMNYGINIMLQKRTGMLSGWLSYSLGRALRRFDSLAKNKYYPANHERIHEFNAVGSYSLGKHWDVAATLVVASGTPFTAPKNFYLINNQLITQYGEHNSNRLKTYYRLDGSINYRFSKKKHFEQGINLSIYNMTYYKNDLFYRLKIYQDQYSYNAIRFIIKTIPSINYYCKF